MQNFKKHLSKKNLKPIINFGKMPLGNGFTDQLKVEYKYKMKLGFNESLNLIQLYENPSPKKMFNKNYAFLSSTSKSMEEHFERYSIQLKKMIKKKNFSILVGGVLLPGAVNLLTLFIVI